MKPKTDFEGVKIKNNGTMVIIGNAGSVTINKDQLSYLINLKSEIIDLETNKIDKNQIDIFDYLK